MHAGHQGPIGAEGSVLTYVTEARIPKATQQIAFVQQSPFGKDKTTASGRTDPSPWSEGLARTTRGIQHSSPPSHDLTSWEVGQLVLGLYLVFSKNDVQVFYGTDLYHATSPYKEYLMRLNL